MDGFCMSAEDMPKFQTITDSKSIEKYGGKSGKLF